MYKLDGTAANVTNRSLGVDTSGRTAAAAILQQQSQSSSGSESRRKGYCSQQFADVDLRRGERENQEVAMHVARDFYCDWLAYSEQVVLPPKAW